MDDPSPLPLPLCTAHTLDLPFYHKRRNQHGVQILSGRWAFPNLGHWVEQIFHARAEPGRTQSCTVQVLPSAGELLDFHQRRFITAVSSDTTTYQY
jgi:hypothetical protein